MTEKPQKEHIAICIPAKTNQMTTGCMWLTARAVKLTYDPKYPYKFSVFSVGGLEPIEFCRNVIVQQFLSTKAQRLWMVDDDMIPGWNAFDLLKTEGDIVAAMFYRFCHATDVNPADINLCAHDIISKGVHVPVDPKPNTGVKDVGSVGTGSIIIHRRIFEDQRMLLPLEFNLPDGTRAKLADHLPQPYFRRKYASNGQMMVGADVDFCERAHGLGYSVKLDTSVNFGQMNRVNLTEIKDMIERYEQIASLTSVPDDKQLKKMINTWGNHQYCSTLSYLQRVREMALETEGPILECGSGVSTLLLNRISAARNHHPIHSLEDEFGWYKTVLNHMNGNGAHVLHRTPIKRYEDDKYRWYDLDKVIGELPRDFSLVICDGPTAKKGRYGLLPLMKDHLAPGCKILLDDANRKHEQKIMDQWKEEFGCTYEVDDSEQGIAVITCP